MADDEIDHGRRFWRLPDAEGEEILRVLKEIDPLMKVYRLSPPHGTVIELHDTPAQAVACLLDFGAIVINQP